MNAELNRLVEEVARAEQKFEGPTTLLANLPEYFR